ncbi:MAG: excinuclease ABC subunit UvrC [Patescibacteria group bacterium]|jgi:excinuclease ABC subunit C|nr:excinuclease ABC subunit UvrC [Patescibacteria group bacterium]
MAKLKIKIKSAPTAPGCYLFKNKAGEIIYIGKAKNIRKRIANYFRKNNLDSKTKELVKNICEVEFFITDNETEALLLEARLINKHQPKYNIDLKDGKRYAHLMITKEDYPRLVVSRNFKPSDEIYGPYTSGQSRQEILRLANRLFKLRVNKQLTKKDRERGRIRLATSPWLENVTIQEYARRLDKVRLLLKGQTEELIVKLTAEMNGFSATKSFELAKIRRDQILALKNISEKQKVELKKRYDQDVINYLILPNKIVVQLFNVNKGVISGRKRFSFEAKSQVDWQENIAGFISQYYFSNDIPQEIILPQALEQHKILEKYLARLSRRSVKITIPKRGDKLKLLELVEKNIESEWSSDLSALTELQKIFNLPMPPAVIEAFDISNLGNTGVVGALVYFKNAKPDKNNYRRFKIKTFLGQSDFDAMKEVVFRRYYRLKKEGRVLPDLIMVDGGKPQLTATLDSLRQLDLIIPVIALAKKEEEIYLPGVKNPIRLSRRSAGLKLLQQIRDEAHRFAVNYQRLLRNKSL